LIDLKSTTWICFKNSWQLIEKGFISVWR